MDQSLAQTNKPAIQRDGVAWIFHRERIASQPNKVKENVPKWNIIEMEQNYVRKMAAKKPHGEKMVRKKNIVGARIRQARKAFPGGLTQDQLSGKLAALNVQLDRAGIAKVELGIRHVFDYEVAALARALKIDLKWLLGVEVH
jgi:hypothetical protein